MLADRAMAMVPVQELLEHMKGEHSGRDPRIDREVVADHRDRFRQHVNSAPPSNAPAASATNGVTTCENTRSGSSRAPLPTNANALMASPATTIQPSADIARHTIGRPGQLGHRERLAVPLSTGTGSAAAVRLQRAARNGVLHLSGVPAVECRSVTFGYLTKDFRLLTVSPVR